MKGTNVLNLNYATVMEAIQEYLTKRMVEQPVVRGIGAMGCSGWSAHPVEDAQGNITTTGTLEVRFTEPVDFLKGVKT
jgi:hypothetical protein